PQKISAAFPPPALQNSLVLEFEQDQLEKLPRDFLAPGDIGDQYRPLSVFLGEHHQSLERILGFLGQHSRDILDRAARLKFCPKPVKPASVKFSYSCTIELPRAEGDLDADGREGRANLALSVQVDGGPSDAKRADRFARNRRRSRLGGPRRERGRNSRRQEDPGAAQMPRFLRIGTASGRSHP